LSSSYGFGWPDEFAPSSGVLCWRNAKKKTPSVGIPTLGGARGVHMTFPTKS